MEEKERYEWNSPYDSAVRDNKNDDIINAIERLNEQDKRIKELEKENQQLKQQVEFYKEENKINKKDCDYYFDEYTLCKRKIKDLEQENQQLKQQLNDLPKKIVEEIRDVAGDYWEECGNVTDLYTLTMEDFDEILDTILEKFGEEDE